MIFIDPSELREKSNLLKYLGDLAYLVLPDLEARTGADVMVSPNGLPKPINDKLLAIHVQQGCKLIQVKFGQDLASSIVDKRIFNQLSTMLKTGAQAWQCLLLLVGRLGYDDTQEMATIDGQLTLTDPPLTWKAVQSALIFWAERGGTIDFPLPSGELMPEHLTIHQNHLDRFKSGEGTKTLWPAKPAFYEEMETDGTLLSEWRAAQKIKVVDKFKVMLWSFGLGQEQTLNTCEFMGHNNIRQDLGGFVSLLEGDKPLILEVPGVGKKTHDKIMWTLWRTEKERKAKNE